MRHTFLFPLCLSLLAASGCITSRLDLTHIDEPVLLNDPHPAGATPASLQAEMVGRYEGNVLTTYVMGPEYGWSHLNDAEALAFERIGGTAEFIGDLTIEVRSYGFNFLLLLVPQVDIEAVGSVKEFR